MLLYLLSAFVFLGLVQGQARQNCPHVSSLSCFCDQNDPVRCNAQGFVKLSDGTFCTGCRVNLPQHENGRCPPVRCYALEYAPGCEILPQFVLVGLKMCPSCQALHCPTEMPIVTI